MDLAAINGAGTTDAGVAHGARLIAFTEAVMRQDDAALVHARAELRAVLTPDEFVDTCAVIGSFNVVDRIADATGIPLDAPMVDMSADLRRELNLARFRSSANTPAVSGS